MVHDKTVVEAKQKSKKIILKRDMEVLCELDNLLEIEWLQENDV